MTVVTPAARARTRAPQQMPRARRFLCILFALYAVYAVAMAFLHEPFRDEAQQWFFVRDQGFAEMLSHLHYEGHPALWYLLLWPMAHAGLPFVSVTVLHLCIALLAGALFVFLAPVPPLPKTLLLFSMAFGFQYTVVARSYILVALLLFLLAWLFPRRRQGKWPWVWGLLLALLCNVHLLGVACAAAIVLADALTLPRTLRAGGWRRALAGVAAGAAGLALGMLLVWLTLRAGQYARSRLQPDLSGLALLKAYLSAGWDMFRRGFVGSIPYFAVSPFSSRAVSTAWNAAMAPLFSIVLPALAVVLALRRAYTALLIGVFTLLAGVLSYTVAGLNDNHAEVVVLLLMFAWWTGAAEPFGRADRWWAVAADFLRVGRVRVAALLAALSLAAGCAIGLSFAWNDAVGPYSQSVAAGKYLRTHGYDTASDRLITAYPGEASAILPFLVHITYFTVPTLAGRMTYSPWTAAETDYILHSPEQGAFLSGRQLYEQSGLTPIVLCIRRAQTVPDDYVLLYDGTGRHTAIDDEQFCLYTLKATQNP